MQSLSDTGADKVRQFYTISEYPGHVLILTERPEVVTFESWPDKPKAVFRATHEETGETHLYIGGSQRLLDQARHLADHWTGPVRCAVATKTTRYGKASAWLVDAPPVAAHAEITRPIYSPLEQDARKRWWAIVEANGIAREIVQASVNQRTDEMGRIDYPALLRDVQAKYPTPADVH